MEINIDFSQNDRKKCCELAIVACSLNSTLNFKSVSTYTDIFKWVDFFYSVQG